MLDIVMQFVALGLLAGGMGLGYWKLIRPYARALDLQQRGALFLTLLALVGGFLGSPFWWLDESPSFAWDLPPLASRMLASAGLSFFVVCLLILRRPTFRRLRLVMLLLFLYLAPLVGVIALFHLDRFDPRASITYAFFLIAGGMTVASAWYLVRPCAILPDTPRDTAPASGVSKGWLIAVAALTSMWGVALFITDTGPSNLIWVWPGDLLSSRLIGVMLLTIAAGAVYSWRYADLARMMLATIITYAFGLSAASLWNLVLGQPIRSSYFVAFGLVGLASAAVLWRERAALPD